MEIMSSQDLLSHFYSRLCVKNDMFIMSSVKNSHLPSLPVQIHPGIVRLMQGREPFDNSMDGMDMEVMKGFTWETIISR